MNGFLKGYVKVTNLWGPHVIMILCMWMLGVVEFKEAQNRGLPRAGGDENFGVNDDRMVWGLAGVYESVITYIYDRCIALAAQSLTVGRRKYMWREWATVGHENERKECFKETMALTFRTLSLMFPWSNCVERISRQFKM